MHEGQRVNVAAQLWIRTRSHAGTVWLARPSRLRPGRIRRLLGRSNAGPVKNCAIVGHVLFQLQKAQS